MWSGSSVLARVKRLSAPKWAFDQVEPRGLGGRPHRVDAKLLEQREEARMVVDLMQVIRDHVELLPRVAAAQPLEGVEQLGQTFALAKQPIEAIGVHVVEAEELLGALAPVVGGAPALGLVAPSPGHAADRVLSKISAETTHSAIRW